MLKLPFFSKIEKSQIILLAGAGGGFDIFCGLPLYFGLLAQGKTVHLANLSFSVLPPVSENRITPALLKVTEKTWQVYDYFPEKHLSRWLSEKLEKEIPIYCFERVGVKPIQEAYAALVNDLEIDTLILIDGGTDSLMFGDEIGLGTPHEDITSIVAASEVSAEQKMLVCLGFGVDYFHGVCHAHFLENVAKITKNGGYLGAFSLIEEMEEVSFYRQAVEAVYETMSPHVSIVSSSILSALAGNYGNYHATQRTQDSKLWINPLMSMYWCFELEKIAEQIIYREEMKETVNFTDVGLVIESVRARLEKLRQWEDMMA